MDIGLMVDKFYNHLVTIDLDKRCIRIFRVMPSGENVLFTELTLPDEDGRGWTDELTAVAHALGEDLLMDSPVTRKVFAL